jgi:N-acetylmuramoyl-L-alanine amidase
MKKHIAITLTTAMIFIAFSGAARAEGVLKIVTQETIINREIAAGATDNRVTRNALVFWIGEKKDGWYHVRLRNGEDGWIPDWAAEPAPDDSVPVPAFAPETLPTTTAPLYGTVVADNVTWRIAPYGGLNAKLDTTRGGAIPRGCVLKLTDKIFHWFQAQISATDYVWVYDEALSPVNKPANVSDYGVPIARLVNSNVEAADGPALGFELTAPVPYLVESNLDPAEVAFKLFGVRSESAPADWGAACANSAGICALLPKTDVLAGDFSAPSGKIAGFRAGFSENEFILGIRDAVRAPIKKIVIDPGHGAVDPPPKGFADGTHNAKGLKEKDVVMAISKKLAEDLQAAGFEAMLTREGNSNETLDIYRRVEFSNAAGADLFVSVHANGDEIKAMQGAEVYWYEPQSRPLAEYIAADISAATGRNTGGVFYASFGVIRQTAVPAVLVETGYMTNPDEGARFGDPIFLDQCADGIARGIVKYIDSLKSGSGND